MFNPHHQQQQFHQHLRQLQQLFQQQTPPPPPPPPPPQPPPGHHIPHHHAGARPIAVPAPAPPPARMVNLCSATQTIIAPNPMLQGALLMQQMQGSMRNFAMGGQQFQQFFAAGSRASILGPVPLGVAIKTPHMGYPPRHFHPHARYFNSDFQSRQPDRKRDNEHSSAGGTDSQSGPSSSRVVIDEAVADVKGQSSTQQAEEPVAKKQRTDGTEDSLATESALSTEYERPAGDAVAADCVPEEDGSVTAPEAAEASEPSRAAELVEGPKALLEDVEQQGVTESVDNGGEETERPSAVRSSEEARDGEGGGEEEEEEEEASSKFYCYICNITCHNQQNFQRHMNALAHQQRMMEIQHMSNACLVTLLPRVQESLQGARKEGEKRPGLQRWCATCQTHFTANVMDHRKTREHKICSRSSSPRCTVCKQQFRTSREFLEHMETTEHKQRMELLWKQTGREKMDQLTSEAYALAVDDEGMDSEEEERADEENGQEGLPVQMEVTLEDITEDEEFDSGTVYGSSFVIPVAGFLCRLCNQFYHFESSALHSHCKTTQHFQNLKRYKALKLQEDSAKGPEPRAGSCSENDAADSDIRLAPTSSTQTAIHQGSTTSTNSSNSHPPSPNQQPSLPGDNLEEEGEEEEAATMVAVMAPIDAPDEEEEVASSVPVEEKTSRGRGRTPSKKRGRGGRRR